MFRLVLFEALVTYANKEGFGLTPLSGDRRGYMPPLLKTNKNKNSRLNYLNKRAFKYDVRFLGGLVGQAESDFTK